MLSLTEMVDKYMDEYQGAPQYKTYSQTLKKNIATKSQVQSEFIANLQTMKILTDDTLVEEKINKILKKFE